MCSLKTQTENNWIRNSGREMSSNEAYTELNEGKPLCFGGREMTFFCLAFSLQGRKRSQKTQKGKRSQKTQKGKRSQKTQTGNN